MKSRTSSMIAVAAFACGMQAVAAHAVPLHESNAAVLERIVESRTWGRPAGTTFPNQYARRFDLEGITLDMTANAIRDRLLELDFPENCRMFAPCFRGATEDEPDLRSRRLELRFTGAPGLSASARITDPPDMAEYHHTAGMVHAPFELVVPYEIRYARRYRPGVFDADAFLGDMVGRYGAPAYAQEPGGEETVYVWTASDPPGVDIQAILPIGGRAVLERLYAPDPDALPARTVLDVDYCVSLTIRNLAGRNVQNYDFDQPCIWRALEIIPLIYEEVPAVLQVALGADGYEARLISPVDTWYRTIGIGELDELERVIRLVIDEQREAVTR